MTQPDRPQGRGRRLAATPVKAAANELMLPVSTPLKLRPFTAELASLEPDIFVLASYGKILAADLLQIPKFGALNVHPSLLPLYRGATPIQSVLRDGRTETGVTIIMMDAGMDTGDVVMQEATRILADENYGELHDRLAVQGARLLEVSIANVARGHLSVVSQKGEGSVTRPLRNADLFVQWEWAAKRINHTIRAFAPKPAARASLQGTTVKLLAAHVAQSAESVQTVSATPGSVLGFQGEAALVVCGQGILAIDRLIPPDRSAVSGAAFVRSLKSQR